MKERLLSFLCCPGCGSHFDLRSEEFEDGEIKSGELLCANCAKEYPIRDFIPRMIEAFQDEPVKRTAENFGAQWTAFTEMFSFYRELFLDWVNPLKEADFKDKVVLDAGCGMGRFLYYSASFGARETIGVDLSRSVDTAWRLLGKKPNVHIVQADIMNLPFKRSFDLFYSIGVLHHMPDPEAGFHSLCSKLKPGGIAHAWVYGYENNAWIVNYFNPIRDRLTSRLPAGALSFFSFLIALVLHPPLRLFYLPAGKYDIKTLKKTLPYFPYLYWLSQRTFRHTHVVIHDHLTAPIAHYIKKEDFESWFGKADLTDLKLVHRNRNSWTGVAHSKRENRGGDSGV